MKTPGDIFIAFGVVLVSFVLMAARFLFYTLPCAIWAYLLFTLLVGVVLVFGTLAAFTDWILTSGPDESQVRSSGLATSTGEKKCPSKWPIAL